MNKILLPLAALAVSGAIAASAFAATKRVTVGDNYFVRDTDGVPTIRVDKGDVVKWVWRGDQTHNVRVTKGPVRFKSDFQVSGTYRKKMRRRGTYVLVCDIHGRKDQSMKLVVR